MKFLKNSLNVFLILVHPVGFDFVPNDSFPPFLVPPFFRPSVLALRYFTKNVCKWSTQTLVAIDQTQAQVHGFASTSG